jgi:aldehyde dehydrogenase (NAD+)
MEEMIRSLFDPAEVAIVRGEADTASALLELPFHHIFFTGSPRVGKIVMKAAAEHLSSVTLELGGKSPVYVGASADLKSAARRIAWGKFTNAGQICVAPDYALIHQAVKADFTTALKKELQAFYPRGARESDSYARIINASHHRRLVESLEDGVKKGGKILWGGTHDTDTRFIEPTLIDGLAADARLLEEEIFGPILPLCTVSGPEEAVRVINARERPLALYVYSKNKKEIRTLLGETRSGTTGINHNVVQYSNQHLPFGGINNSGLGESHGYFGFLAFSNQRSEVRQFTKSGIELLTPPYTSLKRRIVKFTLRWL